MYLGLSVASLLTRSARIEEWSTRRPTDVAAVTAFILLQLRTLQWAISKERKISWKSGPTTCLWLALFLLMLCFAKLRLYDDPIHRIPSEKYYQETRGGLKVANLACCWSFITTHLFAKKNRNFQTLKTILKILTDVNKHGTHFLKNIKFKFS